MKRTAAVMVRLAAVAMSLCAMTFAAAQQPAPAPAGAADAPPLIPLFPSPTGADSKELAGKATPLAHVEVMGSGPVPMILIPGLSCDWTVFRSFMERNTDRYTMYAVTLPGFGAGKLIVPPLPEGDDYCSRRWLKNSVRAIVQMMDERKIDKAVVMGHSLGGHLAVWLGLEFPDRVRGVVAIEAGPIVPLGGPDPRGDIEGRRFQIMERIIPSFRDVTEEQWRKEQLRGAQRLATDQIRAQQLGEMIITPPRMVSLRYNLEYLVSDLTGDMERNVVPMLFIAAVHPDGGVTGRRMLEMGVEGALGAPPKTVLVYFDNCRHFVMDDDPRRLDSTVELFVGGQRIPGSKGVLDLQQAPPPMQRGNAATPPANEPPAATGAPAPKPNP